MTIQFGRTFLKNFKRRISPYPSFVEQYEKRVALFIQNKKSPLLKDHKLIGKLKSYRAFSITGDIRVIYAEESSDLVTFIDIGTHNQVYS